MIEALRVTALLIAGAATSTGAVWAQDVFNGRSNPAPNENFSGNAEDLHKYLSPDGRFIDRCAYWKDHPDADTLNYGQPDHFAAGQPIGNTNSVNGRPAPYVRCAIDPCAKQSGGTICWRNPAAKVPATPLRAQIEAQVESKGCKIGPGDFIYCPAGQRGGPGPGARPGNGGYDVCQNPVPPPGCPGQPPDTGALSPSGCYVTPTGIACDNWRTPSPGDVAPAGSAPTVLSGGVEINRQLPAPGGVGTAPRVFGRLGGTFHADVTIPEMPASTPAANRRTAPPAPAAAGPRLPAGAVGLGDPRAGPEVGAPGVIGSFPGTSSPVDICYTYCLSHLKVTKLPPLGFPPLTWDETGRPNSGRPLGTQKPGDVLVIFEYKGILGWRASHYVLYKGNGIVNYKNGPSDVYIGVLPDYLKNYPTAVIRVF